MESTKDNTEKQLADFVIQLVFFALVFHFDVALRSGEWIGSDNSEVMEMRRISSEDERFSLSHFSRGSNQNDFHPLLGNP